MEEAEAVKPSSILDCDTAGVAKLAGFQPEGKSAWDLHFTRNLSLTYVRTATGAVVAPLPDAITGCSRPEP